MKAWLYRVVVNFGPSTTHNTLESALRAWDAQIFNTRVYSGVIEYREWDENGDCVRDCNVIHLLSSGSIYVLPTIGGLP